MSNLDVLRARLVAAETHDVSVLVIPTEAVRALFAELDRLERGVQAVKDESAKIHEKWASAEKDPSLSWYEDDPALERLSERDDAQDDIMYALCNALGEDQP